MKKNILTVLALVTGMVASAQNADKSTAIVAVENTFRPAVYNLKYMNTEAGKVKVTVTDEAGKVVLVDDLYGKSFVRPYNFNDVPAGNYTLSVIDKNGEKSLAVNHNYASLEAVQTVSVKPMENNRYQLTLIGNKAENVYVNIYDKANELIHTDVITKKGSFSRTYDLSKVNARAYSFEVSVADKIVKNVIVK
jgi:flagellar hook assembly protein FlgD